jgi:hypothetical protein
MKVLNRFKVQFLLGPALSIRVNLNLVLIGSVLLLFKQEDQIIFDNFPRRKGPVLKQLAHDIK